MLVCIVIGNAWATKKEDSLNGLKLMVVQRIEPSDGGRHESFIAVDCVGAGIGEEVLVVTGSSARQRLSSVSSPVDASIVGILDEVEISRGV